MKLNRRELLQWACLSALSGCGRQSTEPESSAHEFVPHVVGANTAITGWGFFDAVDLLSEIGFGTIEVQNLVGRLAPTAGAFPGFQLDQISGEEKERILAALEPFECVTVHLPYPESMPYIRAGAEDAVAQLELALEAARFVGASVAVLHPQPSGTDLNENWATAVERIRKWSSMAADYGFQLACETSAPKSLPDLVRFIDEINHDNVGVTLDVGHQSGFQELAGILPEERAAPHAIKAYNDLNVEIVKTLGEKLIHLHVHDIEPDTWKEHKPLIHGFVDYPMLIAALRATAYAGVLVFEIGGDPDKMPGWLRDGKAKLDGYIAA